MTRKRSAGNVPVPQPTGQIISLRKSAEVGALLLIGTALATIIGLFTLPLAAVGVFMALILIFVGTFRLVDIPPGQYYAVYNRLWSQQVSRFIGDGRNILWIYERVDINQPPYWVNQLISLEFNKLEFRSRQQYEYVLRGEVNFRFDPRRLPKTRYVIGSMMMTITPDILQKFIKPIIHKRIDQILYDMGDETNGDAVREKIHEAIISAFLSPEGAKTDGDVLAAGAGNQYGLVYENHAGIGGYGDAIFKAINAARGRIKQVGEVQQFAEEQGLSTGEISEAAGVMNARNRTTRRTYVSDRPSNQRSARNRRNENAEVEPSEAAEPPKAAETPEAVETPEAIEVPQREAPQDTPQPAVAAPSARNQPSPRVLEPEPNYHEHPVRHFETLASIAQKYGVDVNNLWEFNALESPFLREGQILLIPVSETEANRQREARLTTSDVIATKKLGDQKKREQDR